MNEADLKNLGFVQRPDGIWEKPKRDARVGQVQTDNAQRAPRPLVGVKQQAEARPKRVARRRPLFRIALIGLCNREQDDDNFANACKPLRDAIAEWLGLNDSRKNILWTYGQCHTSGDEGVIVRIEAILYAR